MNKKLILLSLSATLASQAIQAKNIYPAEIVGRKLLFPSLGWAGHVGITTTDMDSAKGMLQNANKVIEVLKETPVGQINTIANFKSRSEYWGSKYGIADRGNRGYLVLVEANHQRWWNPEYTDDTDYHIGSGNLKTGQVLDHGRWRCDTYVWWAFYNQGWDTMPGRVWLPSKVFNAFPYYNDERLTYDYTSEVINDTYITNKTLDDVGAEELNSMSFEEFQMIMDSPPKPPEAYITTPTSAYMRFASSDILSDAKRGVMIDRLTSKDTEPDLVPKLLKLYNDTDHEEVKTKIVSGLVFYNQIHLREKPNARDSELLRHFFSQLMNEKLSQHSANWATTGFIETHSSEEILQNLDKIDSQLLVAGHYASIMIKYSLIFKSKQLERIYIKSIVDELRVANNTDLDSYLFGPLSIGYQGTGKNLLEPESRQMVAEYLKAVRYKYTPQGIKANPKDFHREITAPYYFELIKNMGI